MWKPDFDGGGGIGPIVPKGEMPPHEFSLEQRESRREKIITIAVSVFTEHFHRLGLPLAKELSRERFQFFTQDEFDGRFPEMKGSSGRHGEGEGISLVDTGQDGELFLTMLHEMTHDAAMKTPRFDGQGRVRAYFNGYKMGNVLKSSGEIELCFDALNEAVVEMTAIRVAMEHIDSTDTAGISRGNIEGSLQRHSYRDAVSVLAAIITGIAGDDEAKQLELWKEIECGQYTGEMVWTRLIDTVYGDGSRQILKGLIASPKTDADREKNARILKYFQSKES